MSAETIRLIATLLFGGVVGAFAAHRMALGREARQRRQELIGFLSEWRQEIERVCGGDVAGTHRAYLAREGKFRGLVAKMKGDVLRKRRFEKLCAPLIGRHDTHIKAFSGDPRDAIAGPIDRLLEWL